MTRIAALLLLISLSSLIVLLGGCDGSGAFCYIGQQSDVDEALSDPTCTNLSLENYIGTELVVETERDDVTLFARGDDDTGGLTSIRIGHVAASISAPNATIVADPYWGGSISGRDLDITFDEAPQVVGLESPIVILQAMNGGSLALHATKPMDQWRSVLVEALPSWEGVTVAVDPEAQPTTTLSLQNFVGVSLAQLQPFGTKMQRIQSRKMDETLAEAWASWLESEGYAGTFVQILGDGNEEQILPRPDE